MAESSLFWETNGTGDGLVTGYTTAQMFELFRALLSSSGVNLGGVKGEYLNELAVTGTSSPVQVATGAALVYGIPYFNSSPVAVNIPTPSSATRIDRIVLRATWATQTVRVARVAGTEGGGLPALTTTAGAVWELPLAQVSITTGGVITVTDERPWLDVTGDGKVTTAKLASDAVTTPKIANANVTTPKIADEAVTTAKIADANVTTPKIANANVTTPKIADEAVTTAKIADANVTTPKIANDAVATAKIPDGAVTQAKLGNDTLRYYSVPILATPKTYTSTYEGVNGESTGRTLIYLNKGKFPAGATAKFYAVGKVVGADPALLQLRIINNSQLFPGTVWEGSVNISQADEGGLYIFRASPDFFTSLNSSLATYGVQARMLSGNATIHRIEMVIEW